MAIYHMQYSNNGQVHAVVLYWYNQILANLFHFIGINHSWCYIYTIHTESFSNSYLQMLVLTYSQNTDVQK